jgi:hypothetical protein
MDTKTEIPEFLTSGVARFSSTTPQNGPGHALLYGACPGSSVGSV